MVTAFSLQIDLAGIMQTIGPICAFLQRKWFIRKDALALKTTFHGD
jgi:hypothetical protein